MEDLDGRLRAATAGRVSYDERARELVLRGTAGGELRLAVGREAVRNAMQSALLASASSGTPAAGPDDAVSAGARALLDTYEADPAAAEGLVRRSARQFEGTAAARRRRDG